MTEYSLMCILRSNQHKAEAEVYRQVTMRNQPNSQLPWAITNLRWIETCSAASFAKGPEDSLCGRAEAHLAANKCGELADRHEVQLSLHAAAVLVLTLLYLCSATIATKVHCPVATMLTCKLQSCCCPGPHTPLCLLCNHCNHTSMPSSSVHVSCNVPFLLVRLMHPATSALQ